METLFIYMFKSSICLILFYVFYKLLLSKETFHGINRVVLLAIMSISLIIPSIKISLPEDSRLNRVLCEVGERLAIISQMPERADLPEMQEIDVVPEAIRVMEPTAISADEIVSIEDTSGQQSSSGTAMKVLIFIYFGGIFFFLSRQIYSLFRMRYLLRHGRVEYMENGVKLIIHNRKIAPFSWFRTIIISEEDLEEHGEDIITHENAHINMMHSVDLFICELFILLFWFNPTSWLIRRELQDIHEYQADNSVIKTGIDAKRYQLLLVKKAVGSMRFISMTNSFNHSKLKKRITMMLKKRSNPWAVVKYIFILPLAAIVLTAFANPVKVTDLSSENEEQTGFLIPVDEIDLTESIVVPPSFEEMKPDEIIPVEQKRDTVKLTEQQKKELEAAITEMRKEVEEAKVEVMKAMKEIDWEELRQEMERAKAESMKALKEIDWESIQREQKAAIEEAMKAVKEIDWESIQKEQKSAIEEAMKAVKEIDWESIQKEQKAALEEAMKAVKEIDWENIKKEQKAAIEKAMQKEPK